MKVLYEAMKIVVSHLQKYERQGFLVKTRELVEQKCEPLQISHCSDIPEAKSLTVVRYGVWVKRHHGRFMGTGEDSISGEMPGRGL